jgi:hypothetical protein
MTRILKIEARGDFHQKKVTPAIRLKGKWLASLGFTPNSHVALASTAHGTIQLTVIPSALPATQVCADGALPI